MKSIKHPCTYSAHLKASSPDTMSAYFQVVGWRDVSRKLLLYITDAGFHIAGDGKVGVVYIILLFIVLKSTILQINPTTAWGRGPTPRWIMLY